MINISVVDQEVEAKGAGGKEQSRGGGGRRCPEYEGTDGRTDHCKSVGGARRFRCPVRC